MSEQSPVGFRDILDWLHEQGKRRAEAVPEFDVEKTLGLVFAVRDADTDARAGSAGAAVLSGPAAAVSAELRRLREQAGLTYRDLADGARYSLSTVAAACGGRRLPTWAVTHACVAACGGDVDAMRGLYGQALAAGVRRGRSSDHERPASGWGALTPTERKVAYLVAAGQSNPDIAAGLYLSRNTVQTHVSHILAKLGARSRAEILSEAARHPQADPDNGRAL
jgi:DNA-binding CsgD family transcriptional regulator